MLKLCVADVCVLQVRRVCLVSQELRALLVHQDIQDLLVKLGQLDPGDREAEQDFQEEPVYQDLLDFLVAEV